MPSLSTYIAAILIQIATKKRTPKIIYVYTVTTKNIDDLENNAPLELGGRKLSVGKKILVNGQRQKIDNGVYFVKSPGCWARVPEADFGTVWDRRTKIVVKYPHQTYELINN